VKLIKRIVLDTADDPQCCGFMPDIARDRETVRPNSYTATIDSG